MATALRRDPIVRLGEFLRSARERAGLTLQQVSTTTKIPWRHLDAIEHGDLSVVPKGPYRRGEVRAFAEAVGVDQKVALAQLDEALPAKSPEPTAAPPAEPVEARSSWLASVSLLVVLLVAVAGLTALLFWNRESAPSHSAVPEAQTSPAPSAVGTTAPESSATAQSRATAPPAVPAAVTVPSPETAAPVLPPVHPVLVVSSDPPGARVVVDDIGRGTTPATIEFLSLGEHRVRIVREGYLSAERSINLTVNRPTSTMRVALQAAR